MGRSRCMAMLSQSLVPRPIPSFSMLHTEKVGDPGIRSQATDTIHMKGGRRMEINVSQSVLQQKTRRPDIRSHMTLCHDDAKISSQKVVLKSQQLQVMRLLAGQLANQLYCTVYVDVYMGKWVEIFKMCFKQCPHIIIISHNRLCLPNFSHEMFKNMGRPGYEAGLASK